MGINPWPPPPGPRPPPPPPPPQPPPGTILRASTHGDELQIIDITSMKDPQKVTLSACTEDHCTLDPHRSHLEAIGRAMERMTKAGNNAARRNRKLEEVYGGVIRRPPNIEIGTTFLEDLKAVLRALNPLTWWRWWRSRHQRRWDLEAPKIDLLIQEVDDLIHERGLPAPQIAPRKPLGEEWVRLEERARRANPPQGGSGGSRTTARREKDPAERVDVGRVKDQIDAALDYWGELNEDE